MGLSKEKQKLLHRLGGGSRQRGKEGLFLVEGIRAAREFLGDEASFVVRFAVVSPRLVQLGGGQALRKAIEGRGTPVEEVDDAELKEVSATEQPQGVLLVVEEPGIPWPPPLPPTPPKVLFLDGIQDPGNVGTLVRAARAFGLDLLVALDGTADPWSPKAVRASAGALAHLPVARTGWTEAARWLGDRGLPLLVAEAHGSDVRHLDIPAGWALVLGGEGGGVRPEISTGARAHLAIPMAPGVDSLNVAMAGAILLFSLSRTPGRPGEV